MSQLISKREAALKIRALFIVIELNSFPDMEPGIQISTMRHLLKLLKEFRSFKELDLVLKSVLKPRPGAKVARRSRRK